MPRRVRIAIAVLWVLSLLAVARLSTAQGDVMTLQQAVVYAGDDVGFRVYQHGPDGPVGRVVVRINGRWEDAEIRLAQ